MGATGPSTDLSALAFRGRMLRIGLWPIMFASLYSVVYFAMTWDEPHRVFLTVAAALTCVAALAMMWLPIERIAAGRWCEPFFLTWSASVVAVVSAMVALDGGVASPTSALFFLPLVYASLAYPIKSLVAVGAMVLGAYLGLAIAIGDVPIQNVWIWGCTLIAATWICARQAANHAEQRRVLNEMSRTDPLTESLNRRGFEEQFTAELARCRRDGGHLGLIVFDLDDFKAVNDSHGHAVGDQLLQWVTERMRDVLRPGDRIGRLGGDEFGVLLPDIQIYALVPTLRDRVLEALHERTGASAGLAVYPDDGPDQAALHHAADADLYATKIAKRDQSGAQKLKIRAASTRA
jgi:diguanylate cyclase (GGDEF)-like protein